MRLTRLLPLSLAALLAACAGLQESSTTTPVLAYTLSENQELLRIDTRAPQTVLSRQALTGLDVTDVLIGLTPRHPGQIIGLARSGLLYEINPTTGAATKVGTGVAPPGMTSFGGRTAIAGLMLRGDQFGIDLDSTKKQVRLVSDSGQNLRIDASTSLVIDGDPNRPGRQADGVLRYAITDVNAGKTPAVVALAFAGDQQAKTAYAIDRDLGALVVLGGGVHGADQADNGVLHTVGSLKLGRLRNASMDIDSRSQTAYAVVQTVDDLRARLITIDLKTGQSRTIGLVEQGRPVQGLAIAP